MAYHKLSDPQIRKFVLQKFNNRCAYCGCKLTMCNLQIDHIEALDRSEPRHLRGPSVVDNYNPSCPECNQSKSNKSLEYWREDMQLKTMRMARDSSSYRTLLRMGLIKEQKKPIIFYFEKFNNKNNG